MATSTSLKRLVVLLLLLPPAVLAQPSAAVDARRELVPNASAPAERVEYYWSKPAGDGPFPLVVLIHGHQEGASSRLGGRAFVGWGVLDELVRAGAVAVSVSQPGYGGSQGDRDFCGPRSQAAVKTVLDRFRSRPYVDPKRVALEGISRGAVIASKIATRDPTLAAVVLIGGVFDVKALFDTRCRSLSGYFDGPCWSMRLEMPLEDVGFANRSTLGHEQSFRAPVLILHGENDPQAPASQARALAAALDKLGASVTMKIFPGAGHQVPLAERAPLVNQFLNQHIGARLPTPER